MESSCAGCRMIQISALVLTIILPCNFLFSYLVIFQFIIYTVALTPFTVPNFADIGSIPITSLESWLRREIPGPWMHKTNKNTSRIAFKVLRPKKMYTETKKYKYCAVFQQSDILAVVLVRHKYNCNAQLCITVYEDCKDL